MKLSVIVCTYNREDLIEKCLTHLANQTCKDFELIIVNNNATDRTEEICKTFIQNHSEVNIRLVLETKSGLCAARNCGIREAKGEWIAYIDNDAFANKYYVENFLHFIKAYPQARVCGGKVLPYFESKRPKWLSDYLLPIVTTLDKGTKVTRFKHRSYPVGANMLIHREIFSRYGVFNENLGIKGENRTVSADEKEFFLRFIGKEIPAYYIPNVSVEHWVPNSRITQQFFINQALTIGKSERIRALNISRHEFIKSCFRELYKWCASIALWLFYMITFKPQAANKLIEFRYWVSRGLYSKS
ncbi:MAG: glycosyltransferase [Bacteroidales bacterium]|jgi:glycosyltransferase involved in cell wall biosynthesis|nr:glycosyltransferase [Bacteroidales bacterium]